MLKNTPQSMIHFFDTPHSYLLWLDSEKSQNAMPKNPGTARAEHGAMACVGWWLTNDNLKNFQEVCFQQTCFWSRSILHGYLLVLTSLLVWKWEYLRSPAKNLSFVAGYLADWQCQFMFLMIPNLTSVFWVASSIFCTSSPEGLGQRETTWRCQRETVLCQGVLMVVLVNENYRLIIRLYPEKWDFTPYS